MLIEPDDSLLDLLEQWEQSQFAGSEVSVETLCLGRSDLADKLRRWVTDLKRLELFLTRNAGDSDSGRNGETRRVHDDRRDPPPRPDLIPAVTSFRDPRFHARGGLGEVFEAYDESLRRSVAIKLLQDRWAGHPDSRLRFANEAEITSLLEHPGVVPVHGVGIARDGRPYYAMRFIRGETFQDAIERYHARRKSGIKPGERRLAFRELLVRFQEVCNTVAYAHSKGVLHRDLKPKNIMLCEFGETIVVDWGLAKRIDAAAAAGEAGWNGAIAEGADAEGLTRADAVLGSPGWMSPEQAAGDQARIGPASDVYSLGAILYSLLTGRTAVSGSNLGAILTRTRGGEFEPPRRVDRTVHRALEAVCLKAMALLPEDRYASPKDLADEIGRWTADEPVEAWREPIAIRLSRWSRRRRTLVSTITAALVVGLIGLGWYLYDAKVREVREQAAKLAEARGLVDSLGFADVNAVPEIARRLDPHVGLVVDRLREMAGGAAAGADAKRRRTAAAIALLRTDPFQAVWLVDQLAEDDASPAESSVIRRSLIERGDPDDAARRVWTLRNGGPRARSEFIHFLAQVETKPDRLLERVFSTSEADGARATLVLALAGHSIQHLPPGGKKPLIDGLIKLYVDSPDSGLHSAVGWLLRNRWGRGAELAPVEAELAVQDREAMKSGRAPSRNWCVNGLGRTMAIVRGPVEFQMGSPAAESGRRPWAEDRRAWRIERTFAVATHETTRADYARFLDDAPDVFRPDRPEHYEGIGKYMPDPDCPVVGVTLFEAARYCNWLSLKDGIPESEWCFPKTGRPDKPMVLDPHYLAKTGYRPPTEAEWEFACRGGAQTARPFGESAAWMSSYAWFLDNSEQAAHPVGGKLPNALGLFDMLGNAIEWTFQVYDPTGERTVRDAKGVLLDREITITMESRLDCMLRGGSFYYGAASLRSANRNWNSPALRENTFGFRVARTLREGSEGRGGAIPR